jgi:peptidoglycan hydrolase-like protein with peptidoglycan-binding domain
MPFRSEVEHSPTSPSEVLVVRSGSKIPTPSVKTEIAASQPSWAPTVQPATILPHPSDRTSITRELQRELQRVGCYNGEINGVWTEMTRKAMKDFTNRVNASLPVDQPDSILLSLVKGHPDKACGKSCPAGEGMSQDGKRCIPNALLAQAARKASTAANGSGSKTPMVEKPAPAVTDWTARVTPAAPLRSTEGRMALAGPGAQSPSPPNAPLVADPPQARPTNHRARRDRAARHYPRYRYGRSGTAFRNSFFRAVMRQLSMY